MNEREKAKELLQHYFGMIACKQGLKWDGDNDAEIAAAVDYIIDAAVAEVLKAGQAVKR